VGYRQSGPYRLKLQDQTATYEETARLAIVRFTGDASFLEVLYTRHFTSEMSRD
jgi:outer membrane protein, multidrug efflux system